VFDAAVAGNLQIASARVPVAYRRVKKVREVSQLGNREPTGKERNDHHGGVNQAASGRAVPRKQLGCRFGRRRFTPIGYRARLTGRASSLHVRQLRAKQLRHFLRRLKAVLGLLGVQLGNDVAKPIGNLAVDLADRPWRRAATSEERGARSGWFFRGNGFWLLAKLVRSFQILQSCLEERDECRLNFDAMLLFQVCGQLRSRYIADFRNGTPE